MGPLVRPTVKALAGLTQTRVANIVKESIVMRMDANLLLLLLVVVSLLLLILVLPLDFRTIIYTSI